VKDLAGKTKDPAKVSHKARLRAIELKRAEVELRSAEADLRLDTLRLEEAERNYRWKANVDQEHGVFNLDTQVGMKTLELASTIRQWARLNPGHPVTLNIFSPGGSVFHGISLYDTLRSLSTQGHVITTRVVGYAASMGSLLALAGDVRIATGESMLMFHKLSAGTGGSLYEMEDDVAFYKRLNDRLAGIVVSRTDITREVLDRKWDRTDWWLTPKEAKKLGVIHEID